MIKSKRPQESSKKKKRETEIKLSEVTLGVVV